MFKFSTPDSAHEKMIRFGAWAGRHPSLIGLLKFSTKFNSPMLRTLAFLRSFDSPIGFAAGIDKNAEITRCIEGVGFNFATYGSMTAEICPGNHKPWFHRLPKYKSMMIHVGLANNGIEANLENLMRAYDEAETILPGVSIARTNIPHSSTSITAGVKDFTKSFKLLQGNVGLIEVNISCPNAYCGEQFGEPQALEKLLSALDKIPRTAPVVLKMPSDQAWPEFKKLIDVALEHNVQGITICNLRKDRTGMEIPETWKGNLSGKPVQNISDDLVAQSFLYLRGRLVIIGLGGVFTAKDAYRKIRLGADLVEIASALMYEGPQVVSEIKRGLVKLLKRDGFTSIMQITGIDAQKLLSEN
jgi:dihydroorotate dehydrogenase (fumarate)